MHPFPPPASPPPSSEPQSSLTSVMQHFPGLFPCLFSSPTSGPACSHQQVKCSCRAKGIVLQVLQWLSTALRTEPRGYRWAELDPAWKSPHCTLPAPWSHFHRCQASPQLCRLLGSLSGIVLRTSAAPFSSFGLSINSISFKRPHRWPF